MPPALSLAFVAATMLPAPAEPLAIKQPFLSKSTGDETSNLSDAQFVSHGLVGMGRLPTDLKDAKGDTLGSFSSMAIDPKSWTHVGISYRGRLYPLADRGYNGPDKGALFHYQGRVLAFDMRFLPYPGADLPASPVSQTQIALMPCRTRLCFLRALTASRRPAQIAART
jgi:hypothetical protein